MSRSVYECRRFRELAGSFVNWRPRFPELVPGWLNSVHETWNRAPARALIFRHQVRCGPRCPRPGRIAGQFMKPRTSAASSRNLEHAAGLQLAESRGTRPCRQFAKPGTSTDRRRLLLRRCAAMREPGPKPRSRAGARTPLQALDAPAGPVSSSRSTDNRRAESWAVRVVPMPMSAIAAFVTCSVHDNRNGPGLRSAPAAGWTHPGVT